MLWNIKRPANLSQDKDSSGKGITTREERLYNIIMLNLLTDLVRNNHRLLNTDLLFLSHHQLDPLPWL